MYKRGSLENMTNQLSSNNVGYPLEACQNDDIAFLQIFPEVVWKLILDYLREPTDLENCYESSSFFKKRLSSRRTTFLFPKVFQCLVTRYEQDYAECYDDIRTRKNPNRNITRFPGNPKKKPKTKASKKVWRFPGNYRLVCFGWNIAIEQYYQSRPSHLERSRDGTNFHNRNLREGRDTGYYEDDNTRILKFMTTFEQSHGLCASNSRKNPFLQRSVILYTKSVEFSDPNSIDRKMLLLFGNEIWYMKLNITDTHANLKEFYSTLVEILKHVPNLKALRLFYRTEFQFRQTSVDSKPLPDCAKISIFPTFEKLVLLEVEHQLPSQIFRDMLLQNSHITMLNIQVYGKNSSFIYSAQLPNLKELTLTAYDEEDFYKLKKFGVNLKLKKFTGIFDLEEIKDPLRVIKLVEDNWSGSLEEAELIVKGSCCRNEQRILDVTSNYRNSLPKIKKITLSVPKSCAVSGI